MPGKLPLHFWDIAKPLSVKQVYTGLLNSTFISRTADHQLYVLQKLHPAVSIPGCTSNYFSITRFLKRQRYITQSVMPTKTGLLLAHFQKSEWRLLKGVPGEVFTKTASKKKAEEAGKLLAKFHMALRNYKFPLAKTLPMFQFDLVSKKLISLEPRFSSVKDKEIQSAYLLVCGTLPKLLLPANLRKQIIHTDPKISNFLFNKNGKGVCMIDLDTVQRLSPLYDIGDALRSWCGKEEDDRNNTFNVQLYHAFIQGYLANSKKVLSKTEQKQIPQAFKLVTLGLAARFLNDYIDDDYFGWDDSRYTSRKTHNKARALGQIALYKSFDKVSLK